MPEELRGIPDYCEAYEEYAERLRPKMNLKGEKSEESRILPRPNKSADDFCDTWVPITEDRYVRTKWLTKFDYFATWDSKNVDPYGYDLKEFKGPVDLELYNEEKGRSWHVPAGSQEINSYYGLRRYRWHHGLDIDIETGMPIYASFDGVVRIAKYDRGGYGYYVMLRHENGLETLYGHLKTYYVKEGQEVKAGQLIGLGGSTGRSSGPHLHFETRYQGHSFDPSYIFNFDKGTIRAKDFKLSPNHYKKLIARMSAQYHRIRSGDTLGALARKYGTSIGRICRLNRIGRRTILRIGRRLRVR